MIKDINHITLAVRDINKSFRFYRDILGFKPLCLWDNGAYFLINNLWFCLNVDSTPNLRSCYTHYAFTVEPHDFETMCKKIIDSKAHIFKANTSLGNSLYFLDPDGHKLEIHSGNWQSRIEAKKQDVGSWNNVEWFI